MRKINIKLLINNSNFGTIKNIKSNFKQDVFKFKKSKNTEYFINKYLNSVCEISIVSGDSVLSYLGKMVGGGGNTVGIDRQSEIREIGKEKESKGSKRGLS